MKYIKSFKMISESMDGLSSVELFSLVDQKLIDDLTDLSLYIIDEGFYLVIFFYAEGISIGNVEICHNEEDYEGFPLPIGTEINEIEGYSFTFRHKVFKQGNEVNKEDIIEVLNRVKYLNPVVNIKIENENMLQ